MKSAVSRVEIVRGGGAALEFEAALDHAAGPGADHIACRKQRDRGQALAFEHEVERGDEIGRGIHQRAVEIEYNSAGNSHRKSLSAAAQSCKWGQGGARRRKWGYVELINYGYAGV